MIVGDKILILVIERITMLEENLKVKIANEKKEICEFDLVLYEGHPDNNDYVKLVLQQKEQAIAFSAVNYFEALEKLRRYLEDRNQKILCKGSNENVYSSAMQLDMGTGRNAYSLTLGKQAKLADVVDIFDESNFDSCVSCDKQKDFFEKWIESLNK